MDPEPQPGTKYKFQYVTGRPYDPDTTIANGVFLKKVTLDGREYFLVAEKIRNKPNNDFYIYYLYKTQLQNNMGPYKDPDFTDLFKAIEHPEFKHPTYFSSTLTPTLRLTQEIIDKFSGKEAARIEREAVRKGRQAARKKIGNFLSQAIYSPPIRNANEKLLFTGGPMYKRAAASFSKRGGTRHRRNKRKNKTHKH